MPATLPEPMPDDILEELGPHRKVKILATKSAEELERLINEALQEGWTLYSDMKVNVTPPPSTGYLMSYLFSQMMLKTS